MIDMPMTDMPKTDLPMNDLPMNDIMIIGGGGHGISVLDVLSSHPGYTVTGFVDQTAAASLARFDIPHLGGDEDLHDLLKATPAAVLGLGQIKSPEPRMAVGKRLIDLNASLPAIIAATATASPLSKIGRGSVVFHHGLINADSRIGEFNIINSGAIIEHGVTTGDYVHVAPGAIVLGDVRIGHGSFIGAGATIREGVDIGANCVIGAGAVIRHDIDDGSLIPA